MPSKVRDYKREYERYQGKPEQIKRRSSRNKARRVLAKKGLLARDQDVGHKNGNPLDNSPRNLMNESVRSNRSFPRTRTARKKNKYD